VRGWVVGARAFSNTKRFGLGCAQHSAFSGCLSVHRVACGRSRVLRRGVHIGSVLGPPRPTSLFCCALPWGRRSGVIARRAGRTSFWTRSELVIDFRFVLVGVSTCRLLVWACGGHRTRPLGQGPGGMFYVGVSTTYRLIPALRRPCGLLAVIGGARFSACGVPVLCLLVLLPLLGVL